MRYLKEKDCAKILYNLYEKYYNQMETELVPMTTTGKFFSKYSGFANLSQEEVWAYENGIIFSESLDLYTLNTRREWTVSKHAFLRMVCLPIYSIVFPEETMQLDDMFDYIIQKNLGNGIFEIRDAMTDWLMFESESVRRKDAEKIAENIKDLFSSGNY